MDAITRDIRRGIPWVAAPLGVATVARLVAEPVYRTPAFGVWMALIPTYALLQRALTGKTSPSRIRLAILVNFLAVNVGYLMIGAALRSAPGWRADDLVYAIDRFVFRRDPQALLVPLQRPWLSTVTMLGYLSFAGFLPYLFLSESFRLSPATGRIQLGLMRLYGLGFSGYLLLPAAGPEFHHPQLLPPIVHSAFSAHLYPWILGNCSRVDVCPSLHCAVGSFLLVWTARRHPRLFPWLVPAVSALVLGTVYLQFHYFTDLPFGLLLGALCAHCVSHDLASHVCRPAGRAS